MAYTNIISIICLMTYLMSYKCEESGRSGGTQCIDNGQPRMCYPHFQNHASGGLTVTATNTCGMTRRQKYCIGLSSAEIRSRCAYCDDSNPTERHSSNHLTDHNPNNWWQSETLADNKTIHFEQSINLTLNLGKQFHVTFIHLQFLSPRPRAMVIYRKFNDSYPWTPWIFLSSNCKTYFNMSSSSEYIIGRQDDLLCTEQYSSLNDFYNGVVMFATIAGRPGADDFFNNKQLMDWTTASHIRIELKKMNTFGDENAEEELLMTHFFAIKSLQVAARCWCNGHGNECRRSTGEGIEPKLFCVCHPSHHTTGQSCELCDGFYQDRPWAMATVTDANACQKCDCNGNSDSCIFNEELFIKSGHVSGGLCLNCLRNTKGPHCEECLEGFYKDLNNPNRCIPCNCDPIGRESIQCDQSGQCVCHPGIEGDKCTRCKGDHYNFGAIGCQPCNCYASGINSTARLQCNPSNGICYCKKNVIGDKCDSCVQGYFSLTDEDPLGCRPCFCFAHTKDCTDAPGFVLKEIVSEFESNENGWMYGVGATPPTFTPMLDMSSKPNAITWFQRREPWETNYFLWAPAKFIGNHRLSYNLHLELTLSFGLKPDQIGRDTKLLSMGNDVELVSDTLSVSVPFYTEGNPYPEIGNVARVFRYRLNEESGMWRGRIDYFRFISILSNLVAIRIRLTNPVGFTMLHKAVLFSAVDKDSLKGSEKNLPPTTNVEKCSCPPQYTGLSCQDCATGFHRLHPVGTEFVKCVKCMCNNQSDVCDVKTGQCHCKYNTMGDNCEKCKVGYYGDPTTLVANVCKPCDCPGGTACELVKMVDGDRVVCTDCPDNLGGYRCNRCRDNFFGNPKLSIPCEPCNCYGNIDYSSSCDSVTGKCANCLYNSAGDYCETCKAGYHLSSNKYAPYRCERCTCSPIGSTDGGINCNILTGQCNCHPHVTGRNCDICKDGFFNLTPLQACEPCKCFIPGSHNDTCDLKTGQCYCKAGVTGTNCDSCEPGYFNLSQTGCQKCECDFDGSVSPNCDPISGGCSCKQNVIGSKCDMCIENHHNITGGCPTCPPCYGLIQRNINTIRTEIHAIIQNMNTMNSSDNGLRNISNVMLFAEELNRTVHEMLDLVVKHYDQITSINDKMDNSKMSIETLINDDFKFKGNEKSQNLTRLVAEIKEMKDKIERLIYVDFRDDLEKFKRYINDKSKTNSNITLTAEMAINSLNEVNRMTGRIRDEILKNEKGLNDSYFFELLTLYNKVKIESDKFDTSTLEQMSINTRTDSLSNLIAIRDIDKKQTEHEGSYNDSLVELKNLNVNMGKLFKDIENIKDEVKYIEDQIFGFQRTLSNFLGMEKEIDSRSDFRRTMNKNITDLIELKNKLNRAQQNITDAITRSRQSLKKLEDISKDFDEVIKNSSVAAKLSLDKLPQLKKNLNEMEGEIESLRKSSSDIIHRINIAVNDSNDMLLQAKELEGKFKMLLSKANDLKSRSTQDLNVTLSLKMKADQQFEDFNVSRNNLESVREKLRELNLDQGKQTGSANVAEKLLINIENQLKQIESQSKTMSDDKIELFSKMIDSITIEFDNFEKDQFGTLSNEMNVINEEWEAIQQEIEESNSEIKRLELINSYMIGSPVCHRSGGTVER